MTSIRSLHTFSCSQIRDLIVESNDTDTRKGLLRMLDAFIEGSTFVYTIDEPTMNKIRKHLDFIRSIYTFSCLQIRALIVESNDTDTRKGLLKILDAFIEGSTFVYTIDEPTMNKTRKHFNDLEES